MADKDYNFCITAQDLAPFQAAKENLDVLRLVFDFSLYLDAGDVIGGINRPTVTLVPAGTGTPAPNWRQDYPVMTVPVATTAPADTYPLLIYSEAIANQGQSVELWVTAGTPTLVYAVSFIAVTSLTQRQKQVDTIVTIEQPVNPSMLGAAPSAIGDQIAVIGGSTNLPAGFDGWVFFQNSGNLSNVTITLPPTPVLAQSVEFIDVLGKDGAYPVTFHGAAGAAIDGDGSTAFVSSFNYDVLRWVWTGANWHLMASRFNFLA